MIRDLAPHTPIHEEAWDTIGLRDYIKRLYHCHDDHCLHDEHLFMSHTFKAVSYTHLDVYKRQTVHFDDIHYSLSSGQLNGGYHHTLAVRNQQLTYQIETDKDLPGGSVSDYLTQEFEHIDTPVPVSYTHLAMPIACTTPPST